MILREYQSRDIGRIRQALKDGHRAILYQAPTGSGKTVVFSEIAKLASAKGTRSMVLVSRIEHIKQAYDKYQSMGLNPEIIWRDNDYRHDATLYIASVQSARSRKLPPIDLLFVDEAHLSIYDGVISMMPGAIIIGFSATPVRHTPPYLSSIYKAMVCSDSIKQFVRDGFLSPPIHYGAPLTYDVKSFKQSANDYNPMDMFVKYYDKQELYLGVVNNYLSLAGDGYTICYCCTVEHSKRTAAEFNSAGVRAAHIDGTTPEHERSDIINRFKSGDIKVLCNCEIYTYGTDIPSVKNIILNRATKSIALYLQMCGRGSRISPNKNEFRILDFGGNVHRHGLWDNDREWSLSAKKKRAGIQPVKNCDSCQAIIPASASECQYCGHTMEVIPKFEKAKKNITLVPLNLPPVPDKQIRDMTIAELESYRRHKGYKLGWIIHNLKTEDDLNTYAHLRGFNKFWAYRILKTRKK